MTLVNAFVSSRLDYCNSLLYGISDELLQKLRVIRDAAARVVTGASLVMWSNFLDDPGSSTTSPQSYAISTGCAFANVSRLS